MSGAFQCQVRAKKASFPSFISAPRKTTPFGEDFREKRLNALRSSAGEPGFLSVPSIVREVAGSPGQALDDHTRAIVESRFGHDFSHLRVHTDSKAAESAKAVNALAYTVGQDIVFGAGQYAPDTAEGRRLLAHELIHVMQQAAGVSHSAPMDSAGDPHEREADGTVSGLEAGMNGATRFSSGAPVLQRQESRLTPPSPSWAPEQRGGVHLPSLELRLRLLPSDSARIDAYLQAHLFSVTPDLSPSLDGKVTSLDAVVDALRSLVLPVIPRIEIEDYVAARWSSMVEGTRREILFLHLEDITAAQLPPGLPMPSPRPEAPLVPRGAGPERPREADFGDLVKGIAAVPAVIAARKQLNDQVGAILNRLSAGEKVATISTTALIGAGALAGILSDESARQSLLGLIQDRDIPVPKAPRLSLRIRPVGADASVTLTADLSGLLF